MVIGKADLLPSPQLRSRFHHGDYGAIGFVVLGLNKTDYLQGPWGTSASPHSSWLVWARSTAPLGVNVHNITKTSSKSIRSYRSPFLLRCFGKPISCNKKEAKPMSTKKFQMSRRTLLAGATWCRYNSSQH